MQQRKEDYQERYREMLTLLKNAGCAEEINEHREEMAELLPDIRRMFAFDQRNDAHLYDLWMHCVHTVLGLERNGEDDMLYLAALLHDIGKPDTQVRGKREGDTDMHYYGHPVKSMEIVRDRVIPHLSGLGICFTEEEKKRLLYYVAYHDDRVSLKLEDLRRHLQLPVSFREFQNLMLLQVADAKAHVQIPVIQQRVQICEQLAGAYGEQLYRNYLKK